MKNVANIVVRCDGLVRENKKMAEVHLGLRDAVTTRR